MKVFGRKVYIYFIVIFVLLLLFLIFGRSYLFEGNYNAVDSNYFDKNMNKNIIDLNNDSIDFILSNLGVETEKINSLSLEEKQSVLKKIGEGIDKINKKNSSKEKKKFNKDENYSQEIKYFSKNKDKIVKKIGNICQGTVSFSDIGNCIGKNGVEKSLIIKDIPEQYKEKFLKNYYIGVFDREPNNLFVQYNSDIADKAKKDFLNFLYEKNILQISLCKKIPEKNVKEYCENLF